MYGTEVQQSAYEAGFIAGYAQRDADVRAEAVAREQRLLDAIAEWRATYRTDDPASGA